VADPSEAVQAALRALRARDRTAAELDERLRERGVGEDERRETVETLQRVGYVDDERFAHGRAAALAARGSGDALIRDDLERRGVAVELVDAALDALEPEAERAARTVARRGAGPRTARYLASRGFAAEVVAEAVARDGTGEVEW
jgi:regulatory protein